jgi:hypothetical protein
MVDLNLAYIPAATGFGTASLSSFGGEGQGEEVVVPNQHAGHIDAATHWKVSAHRSIENGKGPPLPNPLLQRRRGRTTRPALGSPGCM